MHWNTPGLLNLLWLLPSIPLLAWYARRRRLAAAARFAQPAMRIRLMPVDTWGWLVQGLLLTGGVAAVIVALARPQFGKYVDEVGTSGADIFVLLDVSKSMQAEDVKPSRLDRAKADIADFLAQVPMDRVGLITFAGVPIVQVPLTTDHEYLRLIVDEVDTESVPRGGSLIGDAIRKAVSLLPPHPERERAILLITDGEDQASFPLEAAELAKEQEIRIFAVGLGDDQEGSRIPLRDRQGRLQFAKEAEGREHWSSLNETLLKEIALRTKGAYVPARTRDYDLGKIYAEHLASLTRGQLATEQRELYHERFQWFVALGVACLWLETLLPRRPRTPWEAAWAADRRPSRTGSGDHLPAPRIGPARHAAAVDGQPSDSRHNDREVPR
jgi:Ca-activated chloride channel family protein